MEKEKSFSWGHAEVDEMGGLINCFDRAGDAFGSIVSDDIMSLWREIIRDGADPIKDGWEDGAGITCCLDGWGQDGLQRVMDHATDSGSYEPYHNMYIATAETMASKQEDWSDDDKAKDTDFSAHSFWVTDEEGMLPVGFDSVWDAPAL